MFRPPVLPLNVLRLRHRASENTNIFPPLKRAWTHFVKPSHSHTHSLTDYIAWMYNSCHRSTSEDAVNPKGSTTAHYVKGFMFCFIHYACYWLKIARQSILCNSNATQNSRALEQRAFALMLPISLANFAHLELGRVTRLL